ncbi:MAG: hypothetical protein NC336_06335 [Clostridium sp.]|nr:hypothetical protein [Clostridium sp.]
MGGDLRLFNPETDMALAADCAAFTPGAAAAQLRFSGALLPYWMADDGDAIIVPPGTAGRLHIEHDLRLVHRCVDFVELPLKKESSRLRPAPWGWNASVRHELQRGGVDPSLLPDTEKLMMLRHLSSRRTTIQINRMLDVPPEETTEPVFCRDIGEFEEAARRFDGRFVVKLPWSSSGRGVFFSPQHSEQNIRRIAGGGIRRQGGIMVERLLNHLRDFAVLFRIADGKVCYKGLSLFFNGTNSGAYLGNIVAPQWVLWDMVCKVVGQETVVETIDRLTATLDRIFSVPAVRFYDGWVGVDMMVHRLGDRAAIAPCVELNLRSTMGVLALNLEERLLVNGTGTMRVAEAAEKISPYAVDLSPVGGRFRFVYEADQNVLSSW